MEPNFQRRDGIVPMDVSPALLANNDMHCLYYLSLLVQNGPHSEFVKFYSLIPGRVNCARWVTTGSNILKVYLGTSTPSPKLQLLVDIIINIYTPSLINIRQHFHISNGSKHFYNLFEYSRNLFQKKYNERELFALVVNTLKRNGFYAHPENILIAMLFDPNLKEEAVAMIETLRENEKSFRGVRKFAVPHGYLRFDETCTSYNQLFDFERLFEIECASPPILADYSINQIRELAFEDSFKKIPCHSQHVERFVYLTSLASQSENTYEKRHAWVVNKAVSSKKFSTKSTKQQFHDLSKK